MAPLVRRMFEGHNVRLAQLLQEDGWLEAPVEGEDAIGL